MKTNALKILCSFIFVLKLVYCYPLPSEIDSKLDKDEKRYPNGTIVGKYSYTDSEGNPIQVKYYADDASYGVELKSVKIMSGSSANPLNLNYKQPTEETMLQNTDAFGTLSDFYNPTDIKYKTSDPFQILKDSTKNPVFTPDYKANPDYEIYFQNELKAPKKYGKEKIRVYLDKEKRKIRDVSNNYIPAAKYCNRF